MLKDILMSVSKKMQIDFEGITSKIQQMEKKERQGKIYLKSI